jgi:hypothetical protein
MDLIQDAFVRLYPQKEFAYETEIYYNRRLSEFNANIALHRKKIVLKMNLQWKNVDSEIKIGLIQSLLIKLFKVKRTTTTNLELYNSFVRNISKFSLVTKTDPVLEASFERVNDSLLFGCLEKPNFEWGRHSVRKLACYNFHSNTVSVSKVFENAPDHMLDLLMYHELLHKKLQFEHNGGRYSYHSPKFKRLENMYPQKKEVDKEINAHIKSFLQKEKIEKVVQKLPITRKLSLFGFFKKK